MIRHLVLDLESFLVGYVRPPTSVGVELAGADAIYQLLACSTGPKRDDKALTDKAESTFRHFRS